MSTPTVYTREQAETALADMGFTFVRESAEWISEADPDVRGRLAWYPDPTDIYADRGVRWFLSAPYTRAEIPVLPVPMTDVAEERLS